MQWVKYPAGAHLDLFGGSFRIMVCQVPGGYEANFFPNWGSGMGVLVPVKGRTIESTVTKTNAWLRERAEEILKGLL